eukprot:COSAG05_NODE_204_length_14187_cov_99.887422_8_plen_185_part_00
MAGTNCWRERERARERERERERERDVKDAKNQGRKRTTEHHADTDAGPFASEASRPAAHTHVRRKVRQRQDLCEHLAVLVMQDVHPRVRRQRRNVLQPDELLGGLARQEATAERAAGVPIARVRLRIIRNARIENAYKYHPCVVSKLRIIWKQIVGLVEPRTRAFNAQVKVKCENVANRVSKVV